MSKLNKKIKPVDAPVYGYWTAFYNSFYSRRLYVDVGKRWRGFGFLYLLFVVALLSIAFTLRLGSDLNQSFEQQINDPLKQLPVLYIQNGELSFDQPMPFFIKNKKGEVVLIIDTTGTVNKINSIYPHLNLLINKDRIHYTFPEPQLFTMTHSSGKSRVSYTQVFDKGVSQVFDGKKIADDKSIIRLKYFSEFLIYPLVVTIIFSVLLIVFPVIALLGQVFSKVFFSFEISWLKASRLLIVSSTPMQLFLFFALTANFMFSGMGVLLFALLISYYSYALFSLRAESKQLVSL